MVEISSADKILAAAQRLAQGRLVAFPTETVYGLGADAENPQAIAKIYAAKQRPLNHPVIVHLSPDVDPGYWVKNLPAEAQKLIAKFWPGPLTLILPRADHIPDAVSGGQDSIGIRCPSHPVAQTLLHSFAGLKAHGNGGVAAPSANKFGQVSPTLASHVQQEFNEFDDQELMIIDGGQADVGIESTILDLSRLDSGIGPTLLRPGGISILDLAEILGDMPLLPDSNAPRVSGSLKAHYAPRTPVILVNQTELDNLLKIGEIPENLQNLRSKALFNSQESLTELGLRLAVVTIGANQTTNVAGIDIVAASDTAYQYAHDIYALLRRLDLAAYDFILLQQPESDPAWQGVSDRISRAAAAFN